ncbi:hypothetical protein HY229_08335 [Candidatus Acetothermia bacterium]|nr:hypothetical protein [Candidatus Acetothermia bacterium]MBI3644089.1 hypothetical protein [Candidatus Acetothermia bacterium]
MSLALTQRKSGTFAAEKEAGTMAVAFFRSCLYDIALCEKALDAGVLRRWEWILRGGQVQDYSITRYYQAIAETKARLRNPTNISAYLIYKMTHGGHPDQEIPDLNGDEREGIRRCIACSAPIDEDRRRNMLEKIEAGYHLKNVKTPFDIDDMVNTHLTQEEMCRFVGHEVSFSYQEKKIQETYDELEQKETDA